MRLRVSTRSGRAHASGLHRQSELTVKEPFRVVLDKTNGKTILDIIGLGGSFVPAEEDDDEEEDRVEGEGAGRVV